MRQRVRDRAHRASRSQERVISPDQRMSRLELGRAYSAIKTTSKKTQLRTP